MDRVINRQELKCDDQETIEHFFQEHCASSQERLGRLDVDCWAVTRRLVTFLSDIKPVDPVDLPPRRVRWIIHRPTNQKPPQRESARTRTRTRAHSIKRRIAHIFRSRRHSDVARERNSPKMKTKSKQQDHHASRQVERVTANPDTPTISHWVVEWKGYVIDATIMQFVELHSIAEEDDDPFLSLKTRCYNRHASMTFKSCSDIHPQWVYDLISRGALYKQFSRNITRYPYFFGRESDHPIRAFVEVVRPASKPKEHEKSGHSD